ncbi:MULTISPECIES: S26 family signal peptidase [Staphylococcus]|uniref:S26 family signal peptidase n=1 Tax=Staphylococcus TaxID=1279 RepID=UPI003518A407
MIIPKDKYLVLGDNRTNSIDSRYSKVRFVNEKKNIEKKREHIYALFSCLIIKNS